MASIALYRDFDAMDPLTTTQQQIKTHNKKT